MNNSYYFTDRVLQIGFNITLESHKIDNANSLLNIFPKFLDIGIESRYIIKVLKEVAKFYARLLNQYKFKHHTIFSASFYKNNGEDLRSDETDLFISLIINHNLTETDINNIDVKSQLEHQIQIQGAIESSWMFDKIISMKIRFCKTGELNGSNCDEIPFRSNAILNIQNNDKYCFSCSILAYLHPCENSHP